MAKNKQPANNNKRINVEFDYDKLADAIVRAQERANNESSIVSKTLSFMTGSFLRFLSVVGMLIGACLLIGIVYYAITESVWLDLVSSITNGFMVVMIILLAIALFLFSRLLYKSAKAIENEMNKQFVVSVFSGVASFAAVVVALIALIRG